MGIQGKSGEFCGVALHSGLANVYITDINNNRQTDFVDDSSWRKNQNSEGPQ